MAKTMEMNFGGLLFLAFWLTGWSVGVAFIQANLILDISTDEMPWLLAITHGGSEVGVLWFVTYGLMKRAKTPRYLESSDSLEGLNVRWQRGQTRKHTATLAACLPVLIYTILFAPLFLYAVNGPYSIPNTMFAGVFATAWLLTISRWIASYRALRTGLTVMEVSLTSHKVKILETQPGRTLPPLSFNTSHVTLYRTGSHVHVEEEEQQWVQPFPPEAQSSLQQMELLIHNIQKGTGATKDRVDIPKDLQALRSRES